MDGRHGAKTNDIEMMKFLDRAAVSTQAVLTKMDQVKESEREQRRQQVVDILAQHPSMRSDVITTSSENKSGIDALQVFLAGFALKAEARLA